MTHPGPIVLCDDVEQKIRDMDHHIELLKTKVSHLECRHLNLVMDIKRVLDGDPPLNGFEEVAAIRDALIERWSANVD